MICQNPEDIDPDKWIDKGELTELPEVHRTEAEERLETRREALGTSEADNGPYLEIPIIPEEPETIAMRGGIHEMKEYKRSYSMNTRRRRQWRKRC